MKKWLFYAGGVLTGIVLTLLFSYYFSRPSEVEEIEKATWFEKPGEIIDERSFDIMQVIDDNAALALSLNLKHVGVIYLLYNDEGKLYYDRETVKVPRGKVARQFGVYRYQTKDQMTKTVPIVKIVDK